MVYLLPDSSPVMTWVIKSPVVYNTISSLSLLEQPTEGSLCHSTMQPVTIVPLRTLPVMVIVVVVTVGDVSRTGASEKVTVQIGTPVSYVKINSLLEGLPNVMPAEVAEGLLLATVQVYSPAVVTFRVWVYCAVTGSFNTVSVPSVTVVESLVQVTVVAGPPVEMQMRLSWLESNVNPPDIRISPMNQTINHLN